MKIQYSCERQSMVIRPLVLLPRTFALIIALGCSSSAQVSKPTPQADLGYLVLNHTHVRWPTPESLVRSLQADDDQTRLRALELIGASDGPSAEIDARSSEVELRYAPVGTAQEKQAIVAIHSATMLFGAVAVQQAGIWHRVANFTCWCKYESGDLIGNLVQVESGPDGGSELVLRASGGGTGIYSQYEARFRYYGGELHLVFSFVSRLQRCDPTAPGPYKCQVERRWFYVQNYGSTGGGVLVESRLNFAASSAPEIQFHIRDLELRHAKIFSCKTYQWDKEKFRYTEFSAPNPCKARPPIQ
jgi:hypothetical protein